MVKKSIKYVDVTHLRDNMAQFVNRVCYGGRERIVLQRKGKAMAVLVSLEDLDILERKDV